MIDDGKIWIGSAGEKKVYLYPEMANRHGLIAGASGTGKTVTLKVLIEAFQELEVPVFVADVKGDIAGLANPGNQEKMSKRALDKFGIESFECEGFPVCFWDVFGEKGLPVRTTIQDMGPFLLARLMDLTDIQTDVLNIIFHIAEDKGVKLITIDNLRKFIVYVSAMKDEFITDYGNMSTQTLGAIQRNLLSLEDLGGDQFFGLPELDIEDWVNNPMVHILHSVKLAHNPVLYGTFMLWMLTKLFEILDEVGDLEKPKLVFFFDEAHMLFNDAPKALVAKVEQVVKLIRSKGVGIYFISQSPSDIPDKVLSQLSNRIQHGLRAYTPAEQKAVKAAAQAFRSNPGFKTEDVILDLAVGEALISCLDEEGRPSVVERAYVLPPKCSLKAISEEEYDEIITDESLSELYDYYTAEADLSANEAKIDKLVGGLQSTEGSKPATKRTATKTSTAAKKTPAKKTTTTRSTSTSRRTTTTRKTTAKKSAAKATASKTATRAVGNAVGSAATVVGREAGKGLLKLFKKK